MDSFCCVEAECHFYYLRDSDIYCGGANWSLAPYGHENCPLEHLLEKARTHTDSIKQAFLPKNVSLGSAFPSLPCLPYRTACSLAYPYPFHNMYTKAAVWATSATLLPMWDVDSSGMVHLPNVVAVFRDNTCLSGSEKGNDAGMQRKIDDLG